MCSGQAGHGPKTVSAHQKPSQAASGTESVTSNNNLSTSGVLTGTAPRGPGEGGGAQHEGTESAQQDPRDQMPDARRFIQQVCRGPRVHVGVQLGITHVLPSLCQRQPAALPSRTLHQFVSPSFLRPSGEEEAKVTICCHTRPCMGTPTARGQLGAAFLVHSGSPGGFCGLRDSIGVPRPSLCFPGPAGRSEPRGWGPPAL